MAYEGNAWRVIPDFPKYAISRSGRVMNVDTGRELAPAWNGSLYVVIRKDGKQYSRSIRKLLKSTWPEIIKK